MRHPLARLVARVVLGTALWKTVPCTAQQPASGQGDLQGQVALRNRDRSTQRHPAVVLWLTPIGGTRAPDPPPPGHFTLAQKDRAFHPHLLVIPVGSAVSFPNQDPFFHNVFSLFNGKRFDLGLYEAGSSRQVVFSREGVSYIFCNIHPDMSAVIISLSTPFHSVAGESGAFAIRGIPAGDYELHAWIEGTPQPVNDSLTRRVHISSGDSNSVQIDASHAPLASEEHLNKFGKPYDHEVSPY
jgi:hypothetical protein